VSDPEGGLPWGLRVAEGRTGGKCFTPGRVYDGKLGVQPGSTFRSMPELGPQQCTTFTSDRPIGLYISRSPNDGHPRTVVYGVASSRITDVDVHVEGKTFTLRPDRNGAFLAVAKDYPALTMDVHYKDGRTDHLDPRPGHTRLGLD
jgi:hypothetical protein